MHIVNATFLTSATGAAKWPTLDRPEAALCGRSNVGKSTLLNALLQRKGLARVSRTPGRTQLLNFFTVTVADPNKQKTSLSSPICRASATPSSAAASTRPGGR